MFGRQVSLRDETSGCEYEFELASGEVCWNDKCDGFTELPLKTESGALPGTTRLTASASFSR